MTEYAAIALALVLGAAMGALIREALIKKPHKPRPASPATKIKLAVTAIEAETRARTEPPTMADRLGAEADKERAKRVSEAYPEIRQACMNEIKSATTRGERFCSVEWHNVLHLPQSTRDEVRTAIIADLKKEGFWVLEDEPASKGDPWLHFGCLQ